MQVIFIETPDFQISAKRGALTDEQLRALQDEIRSNPDAGDPVSGTDFRKIRVALAGRGKRGGGRAIFYRVTRASTVYLLFFYAKNDTPDLSPAGAKYLQQVAEILDRETK